MRPIKCREHKEIFEVNGQGQKQWIQNWETYLYLGYKKVEDEIDIISLEDLKAYPVGKTKIVKTVIRIEEGEEPRELFYPDEPEENHKTDRLYKMLYVCPWEVDDYGWLDEIEEVGFNLVHSWLPMKAPWEKANDDILNELKRRNMYALVQLPVDFGDAVLEEAAMKLGKHDNAFAGAFEEPDARPHPNKEEQKHIYDVIKKGSPDLQVWMLLNGGRWAESIDMEATDSVIFDQYPFNKRYGSVPVPGTPAARENDISLPWWTMVAGMEESVEMIKKTVPPNMPIINVGQGGYSKEEEGRFTLPRIEEEWKFYHDRLGLNSFAVYPHGQGQNFPSVMSDDRPESYSIKNQCRTFMEKLEG